MNDDTPHYSLDELCTLTQLPKRTIRFYMQHGLVDRPIGETRAAYYTARHLEQLLTIRKWSQAGLSLERIRDLLSAPDPADLPRPARQPGSVEVWSHVLIADGVELLIDPARAGLAPEQVRTLAGRVMQLFNTLTGEEPHHDDPQNTTVQ